MSEVTVTFKMEASDPSNHTGLTEEDYDMVTDAVMQVGGYDVEFSKA